MQNLSTGEAAVVLQVSREKVRQLCENRELVCDRLPGTRSRWRVHLDSLEGYAEQNGIRLNWTALQQK